MKQLLKFASPLVASFAFIVIVQAEDISTSGWRLWPDREAAWTNDTLYLPAEVNFAQMPVNPPTGGWKVLNDQQGISVTLPTTVEEHFWGKFGTRPYAHNEAQRGPSTSFPNGNYLGVSWWWREIQIPKFKKGQYVVVSFRGARLRAEVYCNGKLCGYTIMTELPFQADLTDAVKPGQTAQLAIRITNPGGNLDWIDFGSSRINWGKYTLPPSHGFGGLDNDIRLEVRDDISVTDIAAINKPDLHQVHLVAEVTSKSKKYDGAVHFQISKNNQVVWETNQPVALSAKQIKTVEVDAQVDSAEPWDLQHPNLYNASASLENKTASEKQVDFGFRFFTAQGIGSDDAILTLNGKRIVVISAISWGYWGRNGLWPDEEMAEREVADAKAIGLNCLQFHRNVGKPAVLDIQDREGLLRYEEPGAGKFIVGTRYAKGPFGPNGEFLTRRDGNDCLDPQKGYIQPNVVDTSGAGPDGDAQVFWEKYEEEKVLEMVKRDRSHPSLIMYSLQNESNDVDLRNPRIYRVFREMHALDPGRIIVLFSGGEPRNNEVLMLPYSDEISYGSKTTPYAGWRDLHTCGGPCNYMDNLYTDPTNFFQRSKDEDHDKICMWGEMLGAAVPDDYDKLVHSFDATHPTGYELDDMTKILDGYHSFLDKWGFRNAFPTDSLLFQAIGYREYYFWQRIIEQSRADNANDYLVVSGWESTTIDNHSGLVDNHRFFKGNPSVIAKACQPEVLFIQPRHMIVAKGNKDLADIFLLNENNLTGPQTLKFTAKYPDGSIAFTTEKSVTATGSNTYGQLLTEGIEFPTDAAGMMNLEATLTPQNSGKTSLTGNDQIEVIDVSPAPIFQNVALIESNDEISKTLNDVFHVAPVAFSNAPAHLDAIVFSTKRRELAPKISDADFDSALARVKNDGTRLVLWPDNNTCAEAFARTLNKRHIVNYSGNVGNLGAPWFGSWFFVRKHWLLDGLPVDCAVDWRYGMSAFNGPSWLHSEPGGTDTDGLLLDAPGMETFFGYGADHNTKVGISGCVIPYGKGQIVLYCLPQLVRSLQPGNYATSQVVCQRLLGNALRPVVSE
ncbi:MAG TPA: glycoside hydrolase family 2 TIM barrel-domain containing protein [Verrucomicrobiae bacterium]|nr:glycoside hydrolase family 2 TIM barrel-domain containing protein [Verrucomicrobiae bacterium]